MSSRIEREAHRGTMAGDSERGRTRSESLLLAMDVDGPQLVEGENAKLSFSFSAVHTVDPHLFARHLGSISHQFTVA